MRVFVRQNLSASLVTPCDAIWDTPATKWPEFRSKSERNSFWAQPTVDAAFYSGYEGVAGNLVCGINSANGILKLWTLIADYDAKAPVDLEGAIAAMRSAPYGPYRPAWMSITNSGNIRLLWNLETPLAFASPLQLKAFLVNVARHLELIKWAAGFDTPAFAAPGKYYEAGQKWYPVCPDDYIPKAPLMAWMWAATKATTLASRAEAVELPLDVVHKEVVRRWGAGAWTEPFEVGRQGRRFWDASADNETGAWLRPDGFVCFTGDVPFISWRRLLGAAWVDEVTGSKLQDVYDKVVWDDQSYWVDLGENRGWEKYNASQIKDWLAVRGFRAKPEKGENVSEVAQIQQHILANCRVRAALPFLYQPHGVMEYKCEKLLNISRVKALTPAPENCFIDLDDAKNNYFPFLWSYLSQFLCLVDGDNVQLRYLLSWMKHAYSMAYYQTPSPGHAIVLAGPPGTGKSFLSGVVLSGLLGGSMDAADNMIQGTQWTDKLAKWPVAVIDDQQGSSDHQTHAKFSNMVKKLVANQTLNVNGKWMTTGEVAWNGRVVISCNDDPESIKLIPHMDGSVRDKISLLKVAPPSFKFPASRADIREKVRVELPFFARFLLEMPYPKDQVNTMDTRYFLQPFWHPDLLSHASRNTLMHEMFETLVDFMAWWKAGSGKDKDFWRGTVSALYDELQLRFQNNDRVRKLTTRQISTALGQLQNRGTQVSADSYGEHGELVWKIPVKLSWDPSGAR